MMNKDNIINVKAIFNEQERAYTIDFCEKIIADNFTVQDIKDSIDDLSYVTSSILPELEDKVYVSTALSILIDDILCMDTLSKEEQDKAIIELIEIDKKELQELAMQVITQMKRDVQDYKQNIQDYKAEAKKRGYCPTLIDKI